MQFKKLLKFIPIGLMTAGMTFTIVTPPLYLNSNINSSQFNIYTETQSKLAEIKNIDSDNFPLANVEGNIELVSSNDSNTMFAIVRDAENGDRMYGWGYSAEYQTGAAKGGRKSLPLLCIFKDAPAKMSITKVASSGSFSAVVINETQLYLVGDNVYGQQATVGASEYDPVQVFTRNAIISDRNQPIEMISISNKGGLVYMNNQVIGWGDNRLSQITSDNITPIVPTAITGLPLGKVKGIYCSTDSNFVWIENEIWGAGSGGALTGDGITTSRKFIKLDLPAGEITAFDAGGGSSTSCHVVLDNTRLFAWGKNGSSEGILGMNDTTIANQAKPIEITNLPNNGAKINKVMHGWGNSAFVSNNHLYIAGVNTQGELCNGELSPSVPTFQEIKNYQPNSSTIYNIGSSAGFAQTDGVISMWGNDTQGQFGSGKQTASNPKPITFEGFGKISHLETATDNSKTTAVEAYADFFKSDVVDKVALAKYVKGVESFPTDAKFTLKVGSIPVIEKMSGTIELTFSADRAFTGQDGTKKAFTTPATLVDFKILITGFAPQTTSVIEIKDHPKEYFVDELHDLFLKENDEVILDNFTKYADIIAPVVGAKYYLVPDTYKIEDNKVSFVIYAEKYFDKNGDEQVGGVDNPDSYFTVTFDAKPVVAAKNEQFPWWWIVVAVGGATFIGMFIWLIFKKSKEDVAQTTDGANAIKTNIEQTPIQDNKPVKTPVPKNKPETKKI